ncbi:MAG: hypothetical protein NZT61_05855 [Deltaproteobacteria bacterium]|nr:hypothetical protein [Deltaproteobacteria bacterium]MCX7953184.1 hypothetical protein [Deltaproteobacteria bacterium]
MTEKNIKALSPILLVSFGIGLFISLVIFYGLNSPYFFSRFIDSGVFIDCSDPRHRLNHLCDRSKKFTRPKESKFSDKVSIKGFNLN